MYIRRGTESTIDTILTQGKVTLIVGARQIGKTTVSRKYLGGSFGYVLAESPRDHLLTKQDAILLSNSHKLPLIVDEIQRISELFFPMKWVVDQSDQRGRIALTRSQTCHLMKGVNESLTSRVGIIEIPPLSLRELIGSTSSSHSYIPARVTGPRHVKGPDIRSVIHRSPVPGPQNSSVEWDSFYSDCVSAYLEHDVYGLVNVQDEAKFYSFMVARAAKLGQLLNVIDIRSTVDVDCKTVKAWLLVLQASNIAKVIQPLWLNVGKRLSRVPKIFFMDTELVCHLTRWTTPEQLRNGAAVRHVFGTFVVSEALKNYMNAGANLRDVQFYRDAKERETDLVIQGGHVLHLVEVKTTATAGSDAIRSLGCLDRLSDYGVGFRYVVCQTNKSHPVMRGIQVVPAWELQLIPR